MTFFSKSYIFRYNYTPQNYSSMKKILLFGLSMLSVLTSFCQFITEPITQSVSQKQINVLELSKSEKKIDYTINGLLGNPPTAAKTGVDYNLPTPAGMNVKPYTGVAAKLNTITAASPAPTLTVAGMGDATVAVGQSNFSYIPPDTYGAVGPNHLVVTLNNYI